MIRAIVHAGDLCLRHRSRELNPEVIVSPWFQTLVDEMRETMEAAPGVGLAAPQIGHALRVVVVSDPQRLIDLLPEEARAERERVVFPYTVLINPVIVDRSEEERAFIEGCMSVPGYRAVVQRARTVTVVFRDVRGAEQRLTASGWAARIIQHEIDHLDGVLYVDRMDSRTFISEEFYRPGQ